MMVPYEWVQFAADVWTDIESSGRPPEEQMRMLLESLAKGGILVTPPGQRAVTGDIRQCAYLSKFCQHALVEEHEGTWPPGSKSKLHRRCRITCKACGALCYCPVCRHELVEAE